jgi:uncharacterized protein (DUF302 family)
MSPTASAKASTSAWDRACSEICLPMTASKMTRHQLAACLYAPLRLALFADEEGKGVFEYDKPSSFFGQYGDDRVSEVGRYLDSALESVLIAAAN